MRRCMRWLGLSMILATALLSTFWIGPSRADEPATPAAAPAPAAPDPTTAPIKPDSTGASYTGANTYGALTGEKDPKTGKIKVTQETLTADVKNLKIGMNMFWTLITGFLVMFMQAGFALVETGLTRAKNVGAHDGDELRHLRDRHASGSGSAASPSCSAGSGRS